MLVIFDLDDTLIETTKCLTPYYVQRAFEVMKEAGAQGELEQLRAFNQEAVSLKSALQSFCRNQKNIYESGLIALKEPLPAQISVELVPGALQILEDLEKQHTLALVSRGEPDFQMWKMEKAGIQPARFSRLVLGNGPSKKSDYQWVLSELGYKADETVVCGDRVSLDLTPAKELGMYTVHFLNGRGLVDRAPEGDVDVTIERLTQLQGYVEAHENQSSPH